MATLQANVLVYVNSQLNTAGETWDIVTTLEGSSGYVPDANLRYVTDAQAQVYIQQWNQSRSTPTPSPTPYLTPVPAQEMATPTPWATTCRCGRWRATSARLRRT